MYRIFSFIHSLCVCGSVCIYVYLFRIAIERIKKGVPVDDVLADKISIERKGKKLVKKPQ